MVGCVLRNHRRISALFKNAVALLCIQQMHLNDNACFVNCFCKHGLFRCNHTCRLRDSQTLLALWATEGKRITRVCHSQQKQHTVHTYTSSNQLPPINRAVLTAGLKKTKYKIAYSLICLAKQNWHHTKSFSSPVKMKALWRLSWR